MSSKNETKKAPTPRLSLSRETVKSLNVRTSVRTGLLYNAPVAPSGDLCANKGTGAAGSLYGSCASRAGIC